MRKVVKVSKAHNPAGRGAIAVFIAVLLPCLTVFAPGAQAKYSGGTGTYSDPYRIAVPEDLNDIGNHQEDWGRIFILINDVNLAQYTDAQFRIIGNSTRTFTGILDGNDHKVCNFTWSSTDRDAIGLFAFVGPGGQIRKLGMENTSIHAGTGNAVGALVGRNYGGKISNCCSTGSISADEYVGGLVGYNEGTLSDCYSTAGAYGQSQVGGLIGGNKGTILRCYSAGGVLSSGHQVGGLVGAPNDGTIVDCFSTSSVTSLGEVVGGLVGDNNGVIADCYSTGSISGEYYVGGLVGLNQGDISGCHATGSAKANGSSPGFTGGLVGCNSGQLTNCFATGDVSGRETIGGLAGFNYSDAVITHCYSTGKVTGLFSIGGFTGVNWGTITNCRSASIVSANENVGGLAGVNYGTAAMCFSTGSVTGTRFVGGLVGWNNNAAAVNCCSTGQISGNDYLGGLVGYNEKALIDNCYSTGKVPKGDHVGGLVAYNLKGTIRDSFWDITTSGRSGSAGGKGKTTVQMKTRLTFTSAGWDFIGETANGTEDIWTIKQLIDYPKLVWQAVNFVGQYEVDFADYSFLAGHWLNSNCAASNDCNGTDLDFSGSVDATDLAIFCQHWLEEE